MGWKTSIIIASQHERPIMLNRLQHDVKKAESVALALPGDFELFGSSTFEEGAYPRNGNLYIGAYDQVLIVGHLDMANSCFQGTVPPVVSVLHELMPSATVAAFELHSVVNLYGYALFRKNELIRARAGSADDGVFLDIGELLPEEQELFAKSTINADGDQVWQEDFDGVTEEFDHSSMGEEFVFEITKRYFGERFDSFDHFELPMTEFKSISKPFWKRLFGMKMPFSTSG